MYALYYLELLARYGFQLLGEDYVDLIGLVIGVISPSFYDILLVESVL
jgi:hypothetical protein